ncbi:MAG TPA: rhodanese-like domain-containing protein [Anaerolineales bacterium]|nr:rhodanese-like domain-containing protein [Anaerolineales bacterium]
MSKKKKKAKVQSGSAAFLRNPIVLIGIIAVAALAVYLIASNGRRVNDSAMPAEVSVDEAYALYQQPDVFVVDVREQTEWDEYHVPNTTLIPLTELQSRLGELPKDKKILVVCRSGNRSQQGRDILLSAGFNATSMTGGLKNWYAAGYPTEGKPAQ